MAILVNLIVSSFSVLSGLPVVGVVVLYAVLRLASPVFSRHITHYQFTDSHFRAEWGFVNRRLRELSWESIKAVDTEQSFTMRLLGVYQVTLVQAGDESAQIKIRGIERSLLLTIEDKWEKQRNKNDEHPIAELASDMKSHEEVPERDVSIAQVSETPIYRAKPTDLAIASLAYGRFIVLAPTIAFTLWDFAESIGIDDAAISYVSIISPVAVGIAVLIVVLLGSVAATIVKFYGFCVVASNQNKLILQYGLTEQKRRVIDSSAVVGLVLQRNIIEQMLGRARLSLLTKDSASQLDSNLLLPSLPISVVESILCEHFIGEGKECILNQKPPLLSCLLRIGVLVVFPVGVYLLATAYTDIKTGLAALLAVVCFAIAYRLGLLLTSTISLDNSDNGVVVYTRFVYERQILIVSVIAQLHAITGFYAGVSSTRKPLLVSISIYAGSPRQYRAAHCSQKHIQDIAAHMAVGNTTHQTLERRT
jgi:putative membrane protein